MSDSPQTMRVEPLVSIIVPVRDGESCIGDTLESALGQTYGNIEVVVVDDGSRDGTRAILDAWVERDSRVRILAQANRGVAEARNRAIAAARGEFIAPLDSDDLWDPTKIERQVRRMIEVGESTGLVYCWWVSIDANGALLDCSPRWRFEGTDADILLQVNYTGNASVPLYRRRYLDQVGGYDVTLRERDAEGCEDLDVALKVAEQSGVAVVPSWLVGYRRRRDNMSSRTGKMWRSHMAVMTGARHRRPDLSSRITRRSQDQVALHLAAVSFWSGAYGRALGWALRGLRSTLAFQILPYVLRCISNRLLQRSRPSPRIIGPGVGFSSWEMPQPLIPYDRIYQRRFKRLRGE
jgi:glycosyltransferase involved in cell wall biosynthesis